MTATQARVLAALEAFEARQTSEGRTRCECCSNWHRGADCPACEPGPMVKVVSLIGLAMVAATAS